MQSLHKIMRESFFVFFDDLRECVLSIIDGITFLTTLYSHYYTILN